MSADLIPAVAAAGGGSALLGGIIYYERKRDEAMRASQKRLSLRFGSSLDAAAARAVIGNLAGLPRFSEIVLELVATEQGVHHALLVPEGDSAAVTAALSHSARVIPADETPVQGRALRATRLFVPRLTALRTDEVEAAARTLLSGLAALEPGDRVVIRWVLRPGEAPQLEEPKQITRSWRTAERAWRTKAALPGFYARGLLLVRAASPARTRMLAEMVGGFYRSRRGAVGALRPGLDQRGGSFAALPRIRRADGWLSAAEIVGLTAWPVGDRMPGVETGVSRELAVHRDVAREGRTLLIGRDSRGERRVALSSVAARHGLAVIGPSGSGKTEILAGGVLSDIAAGYAGASLDPKGGDLTQSVIDRVRPEDADRVVVLDPGSTERPIGLNVLGSGDPDLAADLLAGVIRRSSPDWTVRTELYLRLGLRTLAEAPGTSMVDLPRLFFDESFRRSIVGRVRDEVLRGQWQAFESLSPQARADHVQAPMTRIMTVLSRPSLRGVLANPEPKLDVRALLENRGWLLVNASPGSLGETGARIVTAAVLFLIWSAIEARIDTPKEQRQPVFITIDELASVATTGFDVELMIERLRGLGGGVSLGLQTLGRLPDTLRNALLGNVASLVSFRAGATEAGRIAKELPGLDASDIQSLGRFEVAARLGTGLGSSVSVVTGHTQPLGEPTGQAARIRSRSAELYGSDLAGGPDDREPEAAQTSRDEADLGRARRDR